MPAFERIVVAIDAAARYISALLIAAIAAIMLTQVFFRKVINHSLQWPEELSVVGLAWVVFVGSVILMRGWNHIGIPTFVDLLPPRARLLVMLAAKILSIIFLVSVVWYGIEVFNGTFHGKAPSLPFSSRWAKLSVPVGAVMMLVIAVNSLIKDFLALGRGDLGPSEDRGITGVE